MIERQDGWPSNITCSPGASLGATSRSIGAGRARSPAPSASAPSFEAMAIAKVEPLTTARALRGPFDYRLPERLAEVGVGSVLLVPFGRRRVIGVVVDVAESSELPPDGSPSRSRRWPRGRRRSWSGSASGWPASTARPRLAGWSWCCRPAWAGAGAGRRPGCRRLPPPPSRPGRAWRRDAARPAPAPPRWRGWPARPAGAELSSRSSRRKTESTGATLERLEARGLVSLRARAASAAPAGGGGRRPVEPAGAVRRAERGA